jgi:hypothetical protein
MRSIKTTITSLGVMVVVVYNIIFKKVKAGNFVQPVCTVVTNFKGHIYEAITLAV